MPHDIRNDLLVIPVTDNSSFGFERAVREFERGFEVSRLKAELKRREHYLSGSQRRRLKDRIAEKRKAKEKKKGERFKSLLDKRKAQKDRGD